MTLLSAKAINIKILNLLKLAFSVKKTNKLKQMV